jgi:CheY-like chemotaxis protein
VRQVASLLDIGAGFGEQCAHMNPGPSRDEGVRRASEALPARWSVLLADDAQDLQALIAMWLEEAGHHVTRVSTGQEVVQHAAQRDFDLLVTDILMPDGDGWDAIAVVQRSRPQMRILAISGGAREMPANKVLRAARAAGAIASLEKPFSRPDFLEAVARVMATKSR